MQTGTTTALRRGIGGSSIAAIAGLDPRRDAFSVYQEITGNFTPQPETPRMRAGRIFQRAAADLYAEMYGHTVEFRDYTVQSDRYPWAIGTPDAVCTDVPRVVEIKMVSWDQAGEYGDEIPATTFLQAHWYRWLLDYPAVDVFVVIGLDTPRLYTYERDPVVEENMVGLAQDFWEQHVALGIPPKIGHSEASARWLKEMFPRHRNPLRIATPEEAALLENYAEIRRTEKALVKERREAENQIKHAIGDDEGLIWPGGRFTWRNTKDSTVVDWEPLARSLMARWDDDTRKDTIGQFSHAKPGVRRIHFQDDEEE